jgi:hypothetical protein
VHQDGRGQCLQEERAEQRPQQTHPPAGERGAADHCRKDRVELEVDPAVGGIGGLDVGRNDQTGERRQAPHSP